MKLTLQLAKGTAEVEIAESCNPSFCEGFGKEIFWGKTKAGKNMPISELGNGKFVSHFFDCPKAKSFRK